MMSAMGTQRNKENSLITLAGMSPGAVDLLVFIFCRYFLIMCGLNWGMDDFEKGGMKMSS